MKALTLWQPWATLMAVGIKTIETRSWRTHYRGPLAIHAAARPVVKDLKPGYSFYMSAPSPSGRTLPLDFPLGVVLGVCELIACESTNDRRWISVVKDSKEYIFGNYGPNRFMWVTKNMKAFDEPIPARGYQGLWNWEKEAP